MSFWQFNFTNHEEICEWDEITQTEVKANWWILQGNFDENLIHENQKVERRNSREICKFDEKQHSSIEGAFECFRFWSQKQHFFCCLFAAGCKSV